MVVGLSCISYVELIVEFAVEFVVKFAVEFAVESEIFTIIEAFDEMLVKFSILPFAFTVDMLLELLVSVKLIVFSAEAMNG